MHGLCAGLFGTLTAGAAAVVFDRFDEAAVLRAAPDEHHVLRRADHVPPAGGDRTGRTRWRSLRLCVSGSAPLAADLWHRFAADGVAVLERYGMTETLLTLSNPLAGERRPGLGGAAAARRAGRPRRSRRAGGRRAAWSAARRCAGATGAAPAFAGRTTGSPPGDLASLADDGYVSIRGRRTELIITGGHNVYPAEVEAVLARHPGWSRSPWWACPRPSGGRRSWPTWWGIPTSPRSGDLAAAELAPFKCPREVRLIDALPRNALGKVVRSELR